MKFKVVTESGSLYGLTEETARGAVAALAGLGIVGECQEDPQVKVTFQIEIPDEHPNMERGLAILKELEGLGCTVEMGQQS